MRISQDDILHNILQVKSYHINQVKYKQIKRINNSANLSINRMQFLNSEKSPPPTSLSSFSLVLQDNSRRSLSLYYFSTERPKDEIIRKHLYTNATDFIGTKGEEVAKNKYSFLFVMKNILNYSIKTLIIDLTPPLLLRNIKKIIKKVS